MFDRTPLKKQGDIAVANDLTHLNKVEDEHKESSAKLARLKFRLQSDASNISVKEFQERNAEISQLQIVIGQQEETIRKLRPAVDKQRLAEERKVRQDLNRREFRDADDKIMYWDREIARHRRTKAEADQAEAIAVNQKNEWLRRRADLITEYNELQRNSA